MIGAGQADEVGVAGGADGAGGGGGAFWVNQFANREVL